MLRPCEGRMAHTISTRDVSGVPVEQQLEKPGIDAEARFSESVDNLLYRDQPAFRSQSEDSEKAEHR